jgi:hypothetical protein
MAGFVRKHCSQRQRIAEVPELEFCRSAFVLKLNRITKAGIHSIAGILAMQCCVPFKLVENPESILLEIFVWHSSNQRERHNY